MRILERFGFGRTPTTPATLGPTADTASTTPPGLMLQDLVLLKVPVSWQEAVSVSLEWLDGHTASSCPDPSVVGVNSIGELHLQRPRSLAGPPVQRAAEFLTALLGNAPAPDALREVLSSDNTSTPAHSSLEEFTRALAYFERPGRRADVAAVHARAEAIYAKALADKEIERLRANAQHEKKPPTPASVPLRTRAIQAAAVAVLTGVIVTSGYVLVSMALRPAPEGGPPRYSEDSADATNQATSVERPVADTAKAAQASPPTLANEGPPSTSVTTAAAAPAAVVGDSTLLERARTQVQKVVDAGLAAAGFGLTSRPAAKPLPDAASSGAGSRPRRSANKASPAKPSADSVARAPMGGRPADGAASDAAEFIVSIREVTRDVVSAEGVTESAAAENESVELAPDPDVSSPVYSEGDQDVVPARLVRPQLPSFVRPGSSELLPPIGMLELVVNEQGKVDRVSLVSRSNRLNEKMLLAAGKAWTFEPARRDGLPVRYRLHVSITE